jgi:hypothetical protein
LRSATPGIAQKVGMPIMAPKVFISYSHDSQPHKDWVRDLATVLRANGIDVVLDQWDLSPGQDIAAFMAGGIQTADRVLLICTEQYVSKAEAGSGGVGYERLIHGRSYRVHRYN